MKSATDYVPRQAEALVSEALSDTRVVIINGARQVGKSTLAERLLHKAPRWQARFLDDPQTRLVAESDPVGFLDFDGLMLIDEVQRVPGLWLAIKKQSNSGPRPIGKSTPSRTGSSTRCSVPIQVSSPASRSFAAATTYPASPGAVIRLRSSGIRRGEGTGSSPAISTTPSSGTSSK
jgi:predicted AAA+ superfamily ATPase